MKRALVLSDDQYHPASVVQAGLADFVAQGWQFDWVMDATDWGIDAINQYPLLIISKMNQISPGNHQPWLSVADQALLVNYVERGNGLLIIHSGAASYPERPIYHKLIGGYFLQHPAQCPVTIEAISDHPLGKGSETFTLVDEHYFMEIVDPAIEIFLTSYSSHGSQPAGWRRVAGQGRVAHLTPGHNLPVWQHPSYQAIIGNCLEWCVTAQ